MGSFRIKAGPEEVRVDFFGPFGTESARQLELELRGALAGSEVPVLFNLTGMTDATIDSRDGLVRIQKAIRGSGRRSCWVDDRARFRGLALWVMHTAEDPACQVRSDLVQARKWLTDSVDRLAAASQGIARAAK